MNPAGVLGVRSGEAAREERMPRAFRAAWSPLWIAFVGSQWWIEIERQLLATIPQDVAQLPVQAAATLGAAGHIAGSAVEAMFYVQWWRACGVRLRFVRLFEWLVSISVLDLLASGLTRFADSHPGVPAYALEALIGLGALHGDAPGAGFRAAFGTFGLLCVARLIATAAIQRRGTGRGLAAPLALTLTVWLLGRLVNWWLVDLARGMSPLP